MQPHNPHPQADLFHTDGEEITPTPDAERQRLLEGIYKAQELATGRTLSPAEKVWIAGKIRIE